MHLVLREQHEDREFSHLFHPNNKGGSHEWAVPRGAPIPRPRGYPSNVRETSIPQLPVDKLAPALLTIVKTNNHTKLNLILEHAKELKLSEDELTALVTQNYQIGRNKQPENLIHLATEHGNMELLEPLLKYFMLLPNFPRLVNASSDTAAHIAAERKRERALKKLIEEGVDLSIRNKKTKQQAIGIPFYALIDPSMRVFI